MSGIAGIICFDGAPIEPSQITKITGAMAYRGPDGIHHWVSGPVALGHCMLRTTPESAGETQPLTNEDDNLVLVMDGRLDNREELSLELRAGGISLRTLTDAELVLKAYQLWGEESPRYFLGDFAFAVWDARRQKLFCARDHFGVKPFFYYSGNKFLAFASDEEAFLGLPAVPNEPNEVRIATLFVPQLDGYDHNASWLKDIVKLPPGKTLSVQRTGQRTIGTYWQLEPLEDAQFASDLECEEAFRSVFKQAIRCRMRTLTNPTVMLSGGIDSASIAGAARELLSEMPHRELHTFSAVADEPAGCPETANIRAMTEGYEPYSHFVSVPSLEGIITDDDLKEAAWTRAHPVNNSILLPGMMYLAASRLGHRVMYDGIDGDLVTHTPVRYIPRLMRSGAWREAWYEVQQASVNNTYLKHLSPLSILLLCAWDFVAPASIKRLKRRIGSMVHGGAPEASLMNPDFAKRIHLAERLKDWDAERIDGNQQTDQEIHIRALTPVGLSRGLGGYDRTAAHYAIEPQHPWIDKRLVEFFVRLPLKYKVRHGWTKYLVRKASASSLPVDVRWHNKKRHVGHWFVRRLINQSRDQILSTLSTTDGPIGAYVDTARLRSMLTGYEGGGGAKQGDEGSVAHKLYSTMTLALWLERIRTRA